ncbi:MAG: LysR substrate-binding domain-containing protein [Halioglobus sp.]
MNELECIRAFVKVAEVGSFAEASRQTNTAKSVVTKRVSQLEEHLELQLLQRSTRKLSLTDGGADFFERAVILLGQLDQAKAAVSAAEWGLTGNLKVSCISSFAAHYLAKDLCEFQEEHPGLCVELQQHDRFCDPVQEGFDVCLQISKDLSNVLEKVELFRVQRVIVATPAYLKEYGTPSTPEEFAQHRHVHNNYVNSSCELNFVHPKRTNTIKLKPEILTNTISMIHAAVMSDRYIALMPVFFIEKELINGDLIPVLSNYQVESPTLSAYYRPSSFVSMKVRILINFLRRKYGDHPPWEQRLLEKCPELSVALGCSVDNKPI